MLTIQLDSVKKQRNKYEFYTLPRATCLWVEVVGNSPLLPKVCAKLIEDGVHPEKLVVVERNGTVVFNAARVGDWADNNVLTGDQPSQLKREYKNEK